MKAHLKTIGVLLAIIAMIYLGTVFPNTILAFTFSLAIAVWYFVIFVTIKTCFTDDED